MSFLYPAFLIGGLAIAIPIVLHLLRRDVAPLRVFTAGRAAFAFRRMVFAALGAADLRAAGLRVLRVLRAVAAAGLTVSTAAAVTALVASALVSIAV